MVYMLDSNILYYIMRGRPTIVKEYLKGAVLRRHRIVLSTVTIFDVTAAARRIRSDELLEYISDITKRFEVEEFINDKTRRAYTSLIYQLKSKHINFYGRDLQMAAHAISLNATLVTGDVKRYDKIEGLKLENWTI